MKQFLKPVLVASSAVVFAWVGCGDDTSDSSGSAGAGGMPSAGVNSSISSSSITASSSSTGGSGTLIVECNPVTNEPCNTAGEEACDFGNTMDMQQGFFC